jgi:hypothetical protein
VTTGIKVRHHSVLLSQAASNESGWAEMHRFDPITIEMMRKMHVKRRRPGDGFHFLQPRLHQPETLHLSTFEAPRSSTSAPFPLPSLP